MNRNLTIGRTVGLIACIFIAARLQMFCNELVLIERGYRAVGGEIFVFPVALLLGARIMIWIEKGIQCWKKRNAIIRKHHLINISLGSGKKH